MTFQDKLSEILEEEFLGIYSINEAGEFVPTYDSKNVLRDSLKQAITTMIREAIVNELNNIELEPVGLTRVHVNGNGDKTGDFITIRDRIAELKATKEEV